MVSRPHKSCITSVAHALCLCSLRDSCTLLGRCRETQSYHLLYCANGILRCFHPALSFILIRSSFSLPITLNQAIRAIMKAGNDIVKKYDRSSLRILGSVGEVHLLLF